MIIRIQTERLTIVVETDEVFIPSTLVELMPTVDQYEPHHVEALLENDPAITQVGVDFNELPF